MIVFSVLLAAAASVMSCWVGPQTLLLSSDVVLIFSSQYSRSHSSVSSYLAVMFDILLLDVVGAAIVVVKGKVVEVVEFTVRCGTMIVDSTGVRLG